MEFFSDRMLLWLCFFAPAMLWLGVERLANVPLRFGTSARVVAGVSGALLAFGLIHLAVTALIG